MIIGSTYNSQKRYTLPVAPIDGIEICDAARLVFQCLYLNIFLPQHAEMSLLARPVGWVLPYALEKALTVTSARSAELAFNLRNQKPDTTSVLISLWMTSGLVNDGDFNPVVKCVLAAYGDTFLNAMDRVSLVAYDEEGTVYPEYDPWVASDISLSVDRLTCVLNLPPLYRLLTHFAQSVREADPEQLEVFLTRDLAVIATPLDPTRMLGVAANCAIPFPNLVTMVHTLSEITGDDAGTWAYSMLSRMAWARFMSYGHAQVRVDNPRAAEQFFDDQLSQVFDNNKCQKVAGLVEKIVLLNKGTRQAGPKVATVQTDWVTKFGLEAAELISEGTDIEGGAGEGEGDPVDPPSASDDDKTTLPDGGTTKDTDAEALGNNPMGYVNDGSQEVNNNSIGEKGASHDVEKYLTPDTTSGKPPAVLAEDYTFRMAVITLKSRLQDEPDLDVSVATREALESWCRFYLWVLPTASTRELVKQWGLHSLLSPL